MSTADGAAPAGRSAPEGDAGALGTSSPDRSTAPVRWTSGRWSLEVRGDELADLRCDGRVVLRAVRAVARDADWATAWPREVTVDAGPDALTLGLRIDDLGLDLAGTLRVRGDGADRTGGADRGGEADRTDGAGDAAGDRLVVELDLESLGDSPTNRTGLVVLHPPQLAGAPLQVTHPDGEDSALAFPVQASPHQPAKDIAGLAWEADGLALQLTLEGDVFEMEDQRNWTDASYKTYSRPLDLPFPYTLAAGEHVRQSLVLTAGPSAGRAGAAPSADGAPATHDEPSTARSSSTVAGPSTGPGGAAAAGEELTWHHGGAVPTIGTGHLDLELADPDWPQRLEDALASADAGLALWIVSPSPADPSALAELGRRLTAAVEAGAELRLLGIADAARHLTTPELATALRAVLPAGMPLVTGARSHYTELNREWDTVLAAEPEALAFATTPLFHTLETEQLIEAVAMQRLLATQLTARAPGLPVHVGPITLRPRFANVATRPQPVPAPAPMADPRAGTLLHEAWTVASAAALAVPGVASLTYEQVPGALAALGGADLPSRDARAPTDLADGETDRAGSSPDSVSAAAQDLVTGRSADGLLWAIGDGTTLLLANLSQQRRRVRVLGRPDPLALDPVSWQAAPTFLGRG